MESETSLQPRVFHPSLPACLRPIALHGLCRRASIQLAHPAFVTDVVLLLLHPCRAFATLGILLGMLMLGIVFVLSLFSLNALVRCACCTRAPSACPDRHPGLAPDGCPILAVL